jgi:putative membrane protein
MGKQKKGDPTELVTIPKGLVLSIRLELLLLVAMPLLAVIMAKGLGIPLVKP